MMVIIEYPCCMYNDALAILLQMFGNGELNGTFVKLLLHSGSLGPWSLYVNLSVLVWFSSLFTYPLQ